MDVSLQQHYAAGGGGGRSTRWDHNEGWITFFHDWWEPGRDYVKLDVHWWEGRRDAHLEAERLGGEIESVRRDLEEDTRLYAAIAANGFQKALQLDACAAHRAIRHLLTIYSQQFD